ncbi:apolipoprotein N-acyltransferase [Alkalispirochaeta americana]|uniref:apolipoprotein N-acyltransferase n=1 Tax=Alkalispirochaeta americana TaxID=159291 RepID=UPI00097077A7|nr:apolipoprotein N-acyltransferase [Alkalispirochaeta americana]
MPKKKKTSRPAGPGLRGGASKGSSSKSALSRGASPKKDAVAWKHHGQITGLLVLGAVLFAAAFPNVLVRFGAYPLAFVALVPVAVAVHRMKWWLTPLYGVFYGFLAYALFNYWLATFHPLAIFIVPVIYAGYFFLLFPALWVADRWGGRMTFLLQTLLWLSYEYLRTQGFLGYAYGIMGYALFPAPLLIQIADLGGVWIVSLLVVMPSFFLAQCFRDFSVRKGGAGDGAGLPGWHRLRFSLSRSLVRAGRARRPELLCYALLMVVSLVYGIFSPVNYDGVRQWKVALIQQNVDPWVGGFRVYEESLEILLRQSDRAIAEADPEIVVWSETSFVPSIDFHTRYRQDQQRYELVRELRRYLSRQSVPFVIGNSDGQLVRTPRGEMERQDYNAVLHFAPGGELLGTYRKIHLVPFTEHFPYQDRLPWMHRMLVESNTNFWEQGQEWTVFESDGVRFATPICFEDTFGYLSREIVREGAQVIVNLTNDLWSYSEPSAMQHMGMAVFRAVENRRSMVRSTNGGMTAIIDPNGVLLDLYPPFVEGFLAGDVPVYYERTTLYTAWGDWLAWVFLALTPPAMGASFWLHRKRLRSERGRLQQD